LSSQFTTNASSFISDPEKLIITNVESNLTSNTFLVTILNNGSSQIIITDVLVSYHSAEIEDEIVIPPNACAVLLVNLNDEIVFLRTYEIKVQSSEGYYTTFFDVIF
jgi:archaellum component FlaF (FlaF/FlaG flagellin family)